MKATELAFMRVLAVFIIAAELQASDSRNTLPVDIQVLDRAPHEQRIQYTTTHLDENGNSTIVTNSYVQIQTGLNRWDATAGAFVPASAEIEMVNGNGVIRNAQFQAVFSRNANDIDGLIDLQMPDGERLVTQPIGLALTEPETGRSVFLGEIRDSEAVLLDPNTIMYPDAFDQFKAAIVIRSSLHGIESDIVLQEKLNADLIRDVGIDPAGARLEVWHQVLENPKAESETSWISRLSGNFEQDGTIRFKQMAISSGNAFSVDDGTMSKSAGVPVAKEWIDLEGLTFLIEGIPFSEVEEQLGGLPERLEARVIDKERLENALAKLSAESAIASVSSLQASGGKLAKKKRNSKPVSVASYAVADLKAKTRADVSLKADRILASAAERKSDQITLGKGFVIDFPVSLTTQTNFTFKGDTTYWVSGAVDLYGTTILEGGAVVKYTNYTTLNPIVTVRGPFKCLTSPYNVAIFTAEDDDTVGEKITSSTGSPLTSTFYSWYNFRFLTSDTNTINVHDIHSRYSHVGFGFQTPTPANLWNVTVYNCDRGIETYQSDVNVKNALVHRTRYAFNIGGLANKGFRTEHLTINSAQKLFNGTSDNFLTLTNALICNVTNSPTTGITSNTTFAVNSSAFLSVGRGNHYLADKTYRNIGTANISAPMKTILKQTTTYAPVVLSTSITDETVLSPVAQRDTDIPDLGYHYTPLDYCISGISVTKPLTLTNGVAVGVYGPKGFLLNSGSKFISEGSPDRMNRLVRYYSVQEDPTTRWGGDPYGLVSIESSGLEIGLRFTEVSLPAGTVYSKHLLGNFDFLYHTVPLVAIRDSHLRGVTLHLKTHQSGSTVAITNNIFERSSVSFFKGYMNPYTFADFNLYAYNNLFAGGGVSFTYNDYPVNAIVRDNLFDCDSIGTGTYTISASNNGYRAGLSSLGGLSNVVGIVPDYVSGPLGRFYYPPSGGNLSQLIDYGSRNADAAALYHFTTQLGNIREGASRVDIGFHCPVLEKVKFIKADYETRGDWKGVYGSDGYHVIMDSFSYPPYATVTPAEKSDWTFSTNTSANILTLQRAASTNRLSAAWFAATSFDVNIAQNDGLPHRFAIYNYGHCCGRIQKVQILDTSGTTQFYESEPLSNFDTAPLYLVWDIIGDFKLRVINLGPHNCLISGFFFGPGIPAVADNDLDGLPDYFEDRNGNGILNTGETDWEITYNSANGLVGVPVVQISNPVKE
jgi:hypothetical protein